MIQYTGPSSPEAGRLENPAESMSRAKLHLLYNRLLLCSVNNTVKVRNQGDRSSLESYPAYSTCTVVGCATKQLVGTILKKFELWDACLYSFARSSNSICLLSTESVYRNLSTGHWRWGNSSEIWRDARPLQIQIVEDQTRLDHSASHGLIRWLALKLQWTESQMSVNFSRLLPMSLLSASFLENKQFHLKKAAPIGPGPVSAQFSEIFQRL